MPSLMLFSQSAHNDHIYTTLIALGIMSKILVSRSGSHVLYFPQIRKVKCQGKWSLISFCLFHLFAEFFTAGYAAT